MIIKTNFKDSLNNFDYFSAKKIIEFNNTFLSQIRFVIYFGFSLIKEAH